MSQELYEDEVERLQAELQAEDPTELQQELRDAQLRAEVTRNIAEEREAAVAAATAALGARIRGLQEAVRQKVASVDAEQRCTERRLEADTSHMIQNLHEQRRTLIQSIASMRDTIAATAEELRVGYYVKRPDHNVFFPKRTTGFERVTAKVEAQPKDEEVVQLEEANADLEGELDKLRGEHAQLLTEHQRAAAEATLQVKDNKRKIESLRSHIHRTRNVARSQRRLCEELRRHNAGIVAGCVVLYAQINSAYYGIHGGPKSIRLMEQRQRRLSRRKLLQLEEAARTEVEQAGGREGSPNGHATSP